MRSMAGIRYDNYNQWKFKINIIMEYMEHSNFYAMCDKIRKMEARELKLNIIDEAQLRGLVETREERTKP